MNPPLRDPFGLLDRSPELAPLAAASPALRKAIEAGRPLDAYRALWWATKLGRFEGELADTARALLPHRRIFFKPLNGAPSMFTYNGVGTSLWGKSDFDAHDLTYVATLYIVFFFLPVFPIASYLVRDASNGGRRAWNFMAKVPLGPVNFVWQRSIAVGILALVGVGAAGAFEGYGHNTLHVANGLDVPVTVTLGGHAPQTAAPGGELAIRTKVGPHTLVVALGDRTLESSSVEIPRGRQAVVWNVLGAAPLYVDKVIYSAGGHADAPEAQEAPDVMCGESLVVRDGLDYPLEEPPKSIEMPKGSSYVAKTHMGVAPGGLRSCLTWLGNHDAAKGAHLALQIAGILQQPAAKLDPEIEAYVTIAKPEEAEAFAKDLLKRDDSLEAHRIYQNWLLGSGQRDRAVAEYEARLDARKGNADAEYLLLRVQPLADERRSIDDAVARHPEHAFLRRAQIYVHYADVDLPGTAAAAAALRSIDTALWLRSLDAHVEALVGTGHAKDAFEIASSVAHDKENTDEVRHEAEVLAYRVAHRLGAPEPDLSKDADDDDAGILFVHAIAGVDVLPSEIELVKSDAAKEALRIVRTARKSPDGAIGLVRSSRPESVGYVPGAIRVLLLGEAARRDETRDVLKKLAGASFPPKTVDAMLAYLKTGDVTDDVGDLPLEMRAALDFARSRAGEATAKERSERRERAKASDVLRGPVTVAIEGWPS